MLSTQGLSWGDKWNSIPCVEWYLQWLNEALVGRDSTKESVQRRCSARMMLGMNFEGKESISRKESRFQIKGKVMSKSLVVAVHFGRSKGACRKVLDNEISSAARSQIIKGFVWIYSVSCEVVEIFSSLFTFFHCSYTITLWYPWEIGSRTPGLPVGYQNPQMLQFLI